MTGVEAIRQKSCTKSILKTTGFGLGIGGQLFYACTCRQHTAQSSLDNNRVRRSGSGDTKYCARICTAVHISGLQNNARGACGLSRLRVQAKPTRQVLVGDRIRVERVANLPLQQPRSLLMCASKWTSGIVQFSSTAVGK